MLKQKEKCKQLISDEMESEMDGKVSVNLEGKAGDQITNSEVNEAMREQQQETDEIPEEKYANSTHKFLY